MYCNKAGIAADTVVCCIAAAALVTGPRYRRIAAAAVRCNSSAGVKARRLGRLAALERGEGNASQLRVGESQSWRSEPQQLMPPGPMKGTRYCCCCRQCMRVFVSRARANLPVLKTMFIPAAHTAGEALSSLALRNRDPLAAR